MDEVAGDVLERLLDSGVELANGEKLRDLSYAGPFGCLFEPMELVQRAADRLSRAVGPFSMCIALSKCKVQLQDRRKAAPKSIPDGE